MERIFKNPLSLLLVENMLYFIRKEGKLMKNKTNTKTTTKKKNKKNK